jgi:hypothetical protein
MNQSVSQLLPIGREVVKMTVTRKDPQIDLSKIKISFDWPTEKELEEAQMKDDDAYRRNRCGFSAFKE